MFIFIEIQLYSYGVSLIMPVKTLRKVQSEITKIYVLRLCSWMRSTTEEMCKDELWIPVSTLERNKSPYTISFFPLAFQTLTVSVMDQINV